MTPDDSPRTGYDPGVDRGADPHGPEVGADAVERTWRRLGHELTNAESVRSLVGTVERYGWAPPLAGIALHGVVRGVFEHVVDPYAISQGYTFPLWELAMAINLFRGLAIVAFSWFMYFGVVGSFAGFLSAEKAMDTAVFKVGGYVTVVFVPVFLVAIPVVMTIPPPDAGGAGVDQLTRVTESYRAVYNSPQMQLVGLLKALAWTVTGFLMLPVVEELYGISKKRSVLAVLPVTVAAVVSTQLL